MADINKRANIKININDKEARKRLDFLNRRADRLLNHLRSVSKILNKSGQQALPSSRGIVLSSAGDVPMVPERGLTTTSLGGASRQPLIKNITAESKAYETRGNQFLKMRRDSRRASTLIQKDAKTIKDAYVNAFGRAGNSAKNLSNVVKKNTKKMKTDVEKNTGDIRGAFEMAFSMHILQMYAMPIVRRFNGMLRETLMTFGEFDRKFADYVAKSREYGKWMTKPDFYDAAVGQSYAVTDLAVAAERFAASGIDVTKNQQALTDVMQVARIANINYNTAANGVIRTLQAFHLTIDKSTAITDTMTAAANASTAELQDMVKWFEYAAQGAYTAGLEMQDLSAYLGILSTSGLPNTGTAARQMFLQFQKIAVQKRFAERFGFTDEDFYDLDKVIGQLRDYVQASENQKKASIEVTRLIGGKVTAQQALTGLLIAEPELWNSVTSAVKRSGETQKLYAEVTQNVGHAMDRIRNSIELLKVQFGEMFKYIIIPIDKTLKLVTQLITAIPTGLKVLLGIFLSLGVVVLNVGMVFMTLAGAASVAVGVTKLLNDKVNEGALGFASFGGSITNLTHALIRYATAGSAAAGTTQKVTGTMNVGAVSSKKYAASMSMASKAMYGIMGMMAGWMVAESVLQKGMIDEAHILAVLTSAWVGYSAAKMGGLTPVASVLGVVAGGTTFAALEARIADVEMEQRVGRLASITGAATSADRGNQVFNIEKGYFTKEPEDDFTIDLEDEVYWR